MSVATALARARVRSTSTTSRATPRITSANAHAEPTLPAPMTPTFMATPFLRVCMEAPAGTHLTSLGAGTPGDASNSTGHHLASTSAGNCGPDECDTALARRHARRWKEGA